MKKKIIITAIIAACVMICMGMIFHFSSQEGELSDSISRSFTIQAARLLMRDFDSHDVFFRETVISQLNMFIRKLAHFTIFFSMGALIFGILAVWRDKYLSGLAASVACCAAYACLDEYHQSFVSGRTALVSDIFIDTLGGLIGALICLTLICAARFIIDRLRRKGNSSPPSAS